MSRAVIATLMMLTVGLPSARANFGSLYGGWNSEPTGLENIRITDESLTFDLRACDGSETISKWDYGKHPVGKVEAIDNLHNSGRERQVNLLFAARFPVKPDGIEVFINDRGVEATSTGTHKREWKVPSTTPGIDGTEARYFTRYSDEADNFDVAVEIPQGASTLRVRLRTQIGNNREKAVTNCWQFIYLLAPARDWSGFEKLDVKVLLPAGWKAASNIALQRDGDVLHGVFNGIPQDALELTIQMPPEPFVERMQLIGNLTWIGVAVFVGVMLVLTWRFGRGIRERFGLLLPELGAAAIWGAAAGIAGWLLFYIPIELPIVPAVQRGSYGWAIPARDIVIFIAVLGAVIGRVLTGVFVP